MDLQKEGMSVEKKSGIVGFSCQDKDLWIDFICQCKKEDKSTWEVLETLVTNYLENAAK